MIVPSVADFLTRYPEFVDADPARLAAVLEDAWLYCDSVRWIEKYRAPAALSLAAHLLYAEIDMADTVQSTVSGEEQTAGPITRKTIGPLSIAYGRQSGRSDSTAALGGGRPGQELDQTIYGLRFLELLQRSFGPAVLVA